MLNKTVFHTLLIRKLFFERLYPYTYVTLLHRLTILQVRKILLKAIDYRCTTSIYIFLQFTSIAMKLFAKLFQTVNQVDQIMKEKIYVSIYLLYLYIFIFIQYVSIYLLYLSMHLYIYCLYPSMYLFMYLYLSTVSIYIYIYPICIYISTVCIYVSIYLLYLSIYPCYRDYIICCYPPGQRVRVVHIH